MQKKITFVRLKITADEKHIYSFHPPKMTLHKEISDFLRGNGIAHDTVTTSGHSVVVAHISEGRSVSIIPAPISADSPEYAEKYAESLSTCISHLTYDNSERPLIISEDRWRSQAATTKARILAHLEIFTQIYARNCEVRKIDKKTASEFLEINHSYGNASCRYRYGLYLKRHTGHNASTHCHSERSEESPTPGTLVAVATFSNARKWIKGDKTIRSYEWTRYASLAGVRLSGGMGKLLKVFIDEVHPDDIMTYADLEWSEGKVYEQLGFTLDGVKDAVIFEVDSEYKRSPLRPCSHAMMIEHIPQEGKSRKRYLMNFGSNKYRLKLTDYQ